MKPLVSILIPAYNAESWIADTIQSVLAQTWPRKEIIIVDDGSTDGTLNISRRFESSLLNIIQQENEGASRARNRALRECQGDYIQWLDADDLLAPDKIERQLALAANQTAQDILYASAWGKFYYRPDKSHFQPTPLWRDLEALEWLILRLNNPWIMPPSAWLVSRWLSDKAGPWDERLTLNDDGEYFCRVVSRSTKVKFVSESRCYYRVGNLSSLSWSRSQNALESLCLSIDLETRHVLDRENSERTLRACINRLNIGVSILDIEAPRQAHILRQRIKELGGKNVPIKTSRKFALAKGIIGKRNTMLLKWVLTKTKSRICSGLERWL